MTIGPMTPEQAAKLKECVAQTHAALDDLLYDAGQFPQFTGLLDIMSLDKEEFLDLLISLKDDLQYISEDHR
jgi:hypothetical protein